MLKGLVAVTCIVVIGYIGWQVWAALPESAKAGLAVAPEAVSPETPDEAFERICETVLAEELIFPESYQRVSFSPVTKREFSIEQYVDLEAAQGSPLSASGVEQMRAAKAKPTLFSAELLYSVRLATGETAMQGAGCEYYGMDGTTGGLSTDTIVVDGSTAGDWRKEHSFTMPPSRG